MSWWSIHYNRPLKDPLLLSYTLEELTYEYYLYLERQEASKERVERENDKIEEAKLLENEKWADAMEQEEAASTQKSNTPSLDEQKWMEKMMAQSKQEFGESFGEDVSLDFGQ